MYRITIYMFGKPIVGCPVDKATVESTIATFLKNDISYFEVKKIPD